MVRILRQLEDMRGMKADEIVVVRNLLEFSGKFIPVANVGVVYNIGSLGCEENRFSLIEQVASNPSNPQLGRVSYAWDSANNTWAVSGDVDWPLETGSSEYQKFERMFKNE